MDIFRMIFGNFFERKQREYQQNLEAGIRRNTVGKIQAKANNAMAKVDRSIYNAQNQAVNKATGKGGQQGGPPQGGQQQQPQQQQGGGQQAKMPQGKMPQGKMPQGQMPQGQMPQGNWAPAQGQMRQPGMPSGGYPQAARPGVAPGQGFAPQGQMVNYGGGGEEKTQAIDIRGLEKEASKQVVGWLVAQNGNHKGMDFRLYEGKNVMGTAANCDIVVTDPYLSARHCTVRYDNGNFIIIDLDSRNGTYVNQKRISREDLIDNDTVRLGKTEFKFKSLF